ncbi:MAG: hypothetical protein J3R72DRAFT_42831 [Linnemannia gamsii]|nr:MAG: hypothetical protein J3R72DRAFT_42831 [Linnemannia gamsii]
MDDQKSLLASCLMVVKSFFAMRRSRRFLLALPIVIGIFLILSLQQASDIDLREVSEVRSRNRNIVDNQSPLVSEQQLQQTVGSSLEQEQGDSNSGNSSSHQGDNTNTSGGSIPEPITPWKGTTVARQIDIPDATWTCTDDILPLKERETQSNKRSRQCVVQNLCVDRQGNTAQLL